jgi:toxin HigB-1
MPFRARGSASGGPPSRYVTRPALPVVGCCDCGDQTLDAQSSVSRIVTRYTRAVIVSFRHKGLERLYRHGSKKGVQAAHAPKLLRILSALDVAQAPEDLAIPSFRTYPLKGDLAGCWSIWVNGNWRATFRFVDSDVELVDYQDYH